MSVTGLYINFFFRVDSIPLKKPFANFPEKIEKWSAIEDHTFSEKIMDVLRVDDYIFRSYKNNNDTVTIYVGYYRTQREGAQIHSPKHCLPGSGWVKLSERKRSLMLTDEKVSMIEGIYQKGTQKEVFFYWYDMQGKKITNEYLLKLNLVINSLIKNRSDAAFIRISTPIIEDNTNAAVKLTERFIMTAYPALKSFLPKTSGL